MHDTEVIMTSDLEQSQCPKTYRNDGETRNIRHCSHKRSNHESDQAHQSYQLISTEQDETLDRMVRYVLCMPAPHGRRYNGTGEPLVIGMGGLETTGAADWRNHRQGSRILANRHSVPTFLREVTSTLQYHRK